MRLCKDREMFSLHQGISGRYWSWSRYPIPASPYHWLISPVPRPQTAFYWSRAWAGFCTILWLEASVSRLFSAPGNSWGKNGQLELAPSQPGLWGCQMGARRARLVPGSIPGYWAAELRLRLSWAAQFIPGGAPDQRSGMSTIRLREVEVSGNVM